MRYFTSSTLRTTLLASSATAALLALSACAPSVTINEATDANNPACAPMMVALPDSLADAKRRTTSSQATAAWGDPAVVLLRCGVQVPGPTTDRCVTVNGVDWVITEEGTSFTFTTYGRKPATEVILEQNKVPSDTVLTQISAAAAKIPSSGGCIGIEDVPTGTN